MKKRILFIATGLCLLGGRAMAEDLDTTRRADTMTVSLSPYSFGLGGGAIYALNDELNRRSEQFLKTSFIQTFAVGDHFIAGMDANWYFPGKNWGLDLGGDFLATAPGGFRPFIGGGVGFTNFDKRGSDFGQDFGASVTVRAGILVDILDEMQLRIRVPFQQVFNDANDRTVGLDVGLLFSSPHRKTKVKKLVY